MSLIDILRRYAGRIARQVFDRGSDAGEPATGASDDGDAETADEGSPSPLGHGDVAPEDLETPADALKELGLTPDEFVIRLLEEHDGRLRQQAFSDYTDWSEGTVSRLLQELEGKEAIVRIQIGREKLVCLPGHSPLRDAASSTERDDPQSA